MKRLPAHFYALALAIMLSFFAGLTQWTGGFLHWDNYLFDKQISLFSNEPNPNIVIVTIDDKSLESIGRWPWSRNIHAQFINKLTNSGALAIGLDILFLEPDTKNPKADLNLANAIRHNGKTVLPSILEPSESSMGIQVRLPIQELAQSAVYTGHTTIRPDDSGIVRGIDISVNVNSTTQIPSFVKALWEVGHTGTKDKSALFQENPKPLLQGQKGQALSNYARIPFSCMAGQYQSLSYVDVLRSEQLRKTLYGKYVLVGLNASGLGTSLVTPVSRKGLLMSGTEFNAHALNMLLKNRPIYDLSMPWNIILTVMLVFIPITLYAYL